MSLEPLEVFALTSDMQRATGSIPYTSLMWNRKYYECGDFLMEVPADVYDPSWAYVYTEERPETGIIQKVEYRDTSNGGVDTVILSGFFFEWELNRYTFLVEETEEEAYRIYKPTPAKTIMPTLWTDNFGMTYVKTGGTTGIPAIWETIDGEYVDPSTIDQSEMTQIELSPGEGMKLIEYPVDPTDPNLGNWNAGQYSNTRYSYYTEDGSTLVSVAPDGTEVEYPIVLGGTGNAIYEDEDGFHWVNGVASSLDGTYVRALDAWEYKVESEGLEVVRGDGTIFGGSTYARAYRTVKGPWQLRTDLDVNEPADNVQRVIQWAQDIWGNNILYDEPGFEGESKIIDPSLRLFGDLAYEELKTIEASPRMFYSFESDTCVFEVWRGLDRTQSQAGVPSPDVPEPEPDEPTIDDLYEAVDYIESDGTQYILTDFYPTQNTRVVIDAQFTGSASSAFFGARTDNKSNTFTCFALADASAVRFDHGTVQTQMSVSDLGQRATVSMSGSAGIFGDTSTTYSTAAFTCDYPLALFAVNTAGTAAWPFTGRAHSCQIYADGTTLTMSLMPYRRKADGAVGMLDLVNEVFYESAGSEAFLAPGELPSGYTRLEYIESTGSQYIDTGVNAQSGIEVYTDWMYLSTSGAQPGLAAYSTSVGRLFPLYMSDAAWLIGYNTINWATATTVAGARHSIYSKLANGEQVLIIDGETVVTGATASDLDLGMSLYMFALNWARDPIYASARCYSMEMLMNGATVRDYVPVKNSGGEAGMFDLVTMSFYADASGTGFVAGPEVAVVAEVAEVSAFALTRTVAASETTEETANPFAVFSDTWGTLYGFTASRDVSNYRNTCYVLYQFRDQTDADGNPIGPRGYVTARLEDEMPDAETVLDLRGEEPEDDAQTDEAFIESLRQRGIAHLKANYAIIENLETGTLVQDGYLTGFDLGDKVDMLVEAVGLVKEARITGACEVHEAGSSTVSLEIGEQKITNIRKAVIM